MNTCVETRSAWPCIMTSVCFLWALESTSPNASWEHHKGPSHGHLALHCPLPYPGSVYFTKGAFWRLPFVNLLLLCVRVRVYLKVRRHHSWLSPSTFMWVLH